MVNNSKSTSNTIYHPVEWTFTDRQFGIVTKTDESAWIIGYKGHTKVVSFDELPKESCGDYAMGFALCTVLHEGWMNEEDDK